MFVTEVKKKMDAALEHLKSELKGLRTGRANPAILDHVKVEVYGTSMRLRDVASVSVPEPRQLLITPFDANNAGVIAKGVEAANLNLQPILDGHAVRINIPEMDATVRSEMQKQARKKSEEAKVRIRLIRQEANKHVKDQKAAGDIAEDEMKRLEKEIQDLTDQFCKQADEVTHQKEEEIATI